MTSLPPSTDPAPADVTPTTRGSTMTAEAPTLPPARRPGIDAWVQLTLAEMRMVVRDTAGLVIPIGLPLLILVMNGMGASDETVAELDGMSVMDAFVMPLTLVMVIAVIGIINMPSFLSLYRKGGVLRRLAVTPASPSMVLVAQVLVSFFHSLIGMALALGVAVAAFDISGPRNLGSAVGILVLGAIAMYAVGMLVAAISPTPNAAIAIGLVSFFATMALGGGFGPRENLPDWLARVGEVLPFGAAVDALSAAWTGQTPELLHLGSLVACILVSSLVAARFFRWD